MQSMSKRSYDEEDGSNSPSTGAARLNLQKLEEEETPNSNGNEIHDDETGPVEELHQGGSEVESVSEPQVLTELGVPDTKVDQNSRDVDLKEQQHATRRPYQSYRGGRGGGGRRGYANNRGGRSINRGGYQNGGSQFYDQPDSYHPRNNYRGRGGRGNYNYNAPASHAGHVEAVSLYV